MQASVRSPLLPPDGGGVLVIDKPRGPTSHDVVVRVRRATGIRQIGHTGTLDPAATGVLPLVLGKATRLARFLMVSEKTYDAVIRLGIATDTYDATGRPLATGTADAQSLPLDAAELPREAVEHALSRFRNTYLQQPPPYSAKKVGGVRAYRLARRQAHVTPVPVSVTVHSLELLSLDPDRLRIRLVCSAGFYVRALAHELGLALGCGAHLESLRRTRSGEFGMEEALGLDRVEEAGTRALEWLIPMRALLTTLPRAVLTSRGVRRASHGGALSPSDIEAGTAEMDHVAPGGTVRLLDAAGRLLGLATRESDGSLRPIVVLV